MKDTFSGYYKDIDISTILKSDRAIIVLDSMVLCNLYGYKDDVWKPLLALINEKKNLLWMPYNMAYAYHREIIPTLIQKIQLLISAKNRLKQAADILKTIPFEEGYLDNYNDASESTSTRLTREIAFLKQQGKKDSVLREAIAELYKGRIGGSNNDPDPKSYRVRKYPESNEADALTGNNLNSTSSCTEGERIHDKNDIILHTLIKLSSDKNKDIIYVMSEPSKYWFAFIGKTSFGPNPDHQIYFCKNTSGHNLYCCPFAAFMNSLSLAISKKISPEINAHLKQFSYGAALQNWDNEFEM